MPEENRGKHNVGDSKGNSMASSGWLKDNGSGGTMMMDSGEEDEWRQGSSVMEREQGGRGSEEEDRECTLTRLGHQRVSSVGRSDGSGGG